MAVITLQPYNENSKHTWPKSPMTVEAVEALGPLSPRKLEGEKPEQVRSEHPIEPEQLQVQRPAQPELERQPEDLAQTERDLSNTDILDAWLARCKPLNTMTTRQFLAAYFDRDREFDAVCRAHLPRIEALIANSPSVTKTTPLRETLADIVLLDQITRNAWRGDLTRRVYLEADPIALKLAKEMIRLHPELHKEMSWLELKFIILTLCHSEDFMDGEYEIGLWHRKLEYMKTELAEGKITQNELDTCVSTLNPMHGHLDVLKMFGRYPHRNRFIARESTQEEVAYLENGGMTWGTDDE